MRKRAETLLKKHPVKNETAVNQAARSKLIHELQIHKIELEMQNEELKNANITAKAEKIKYENLYAFSTIGYFTIDSAGMISGLNQSGAALLGMDMKDAEGRNIRVFISPAGRRPFDVFIKNIFSGIKKTACENTLIAKDGTPVEVYMEGLKSADGVTCNLNIIDITARKLAAAELARSEEKYRLLVTAMGQGLALLGIITGSQGKPADFECLDVNESCTKLLGLSRKMCIGKRIKDIAPLSGKDWIDMFGRVALTGEPAYFESYLETTGKYCTVSSYSTKKDHIAVLFTDISERKKAEELIAAKNSELERFVYTVSHDLKNPLVTIQGFAGLIKRSLNDRQDDKLQSYVDYILKAGTTMSSLITDLLAITRIGKVENNNEKAMFYGMIKEAMEITAGEIEKYNAVINISETLLKPEPIYVFCNRQRIVEVLQNLISNAMKFSNKGTACMIQIGVEQQNTDRAFFVKDNGAGIEKQYLEKIFGLFERLDQSVEGTGIGLAIAKRIIELHDGRIWADSAGPGSGSTFYFTLNLIG